MTKIRAVLDQEMWVEVDVPDEFQAIVASLFYSESVGLNDTQGDATTRYGEVGTGNDGSLVIDAEAQNAEQELVQMNSTDISLENSVQKKSTPSTEATESNKVIAATSSAQSNNHNVKERGKSTSQTLSCGGVGYHMVNWLVFLFYLFFFSFLHVVANSSTKSSLFPLEILASHT
jgi:vacuolar protein sorting-associated protein 54